MDENGAGTSARRYICQVTSRPHPSDAEGGAGSQAAEVYDRSAGSRLLNMLRAGVLGANDGIVSVGGMVVGVAGASTSTPVLAISGIAAVVSGALSMAMGEYVSVSTQSDAERAMIDRVRRNIADNPEGEHIALVNALRERGIRTDLADQAADELSPEHELAAHLTIRYGLDEHMVVSPVAAAISSFVAFTIGALVPLLAIMFSPVSLRVPITIGAVIVALALTGAIASKLGESAQGRATVRTIVGGVLALLVGWGIGSFAGTFVEI